MKRANGVAYRWQRRSAGRLRTRAIVDRQHNNRLCPVLYAALSIMCRRFAPTATTRAASVRRFADDLRLLYLHKNATRAASVHDVSKPRHVIARRTITSRPVGRSTQCGSSLILTLDGISSSADLHATVYRPITAGYICLLYTSPSPRD